MVGAISGSLVGVFARASVESRKDSHEVIEAVNEVAIADRQRQLMEQDRAAVFEALQGYVQIAQTAVSQAQSVKGKVQQAGEAMQAHQTQQNVSQASAAARSTAGSSGTGGSGGTGGDAHTAAMDTLMNTQLADGVTVGDRFTRDQMETLVRGDFTSAQDLVQNHGFTQEQADQLMKMKEGGFTNDELAEFVYANRLTPEQAQAERRQRSAEGMRDFLIGKAIEGVGGSFGSAAERARRASKESGEEADRARSLRTGLRQAFNEREQALATMTRAITGGRDQQA
jgi:hypothetical protein